MFKWLNGYHLRRIKRLNYARSAFSKSESPISKIDHIITYINIKSSQKFFSSILLQITAGISYAVVQKACIDIQVPKPSLYI